LFGFQNSESKSDIEQEHDFQNVGMSPIDSLLSRPVYLTFFNINGIYWTKSDVGPEHDFPNVSLSTAVNLKGLKHNYSKLWKIRHYKIRNSLKSGTFYKKNHHFRIWKY
jgi:hypothetical protein